MALDPALATAIDDSLARILAALPFTAGDDGRFAVRAERGRFDRMFGGQMLAQAIVAANATAPGRTPQSIHAFFLESGRPAEDIEVDVRHLRDGRSMATRQVDITQDGRLLLSALTAFNETPAAPLDVAPAMPEVAAPEDTPTLQQWAAQAPAELADLAGVWIETPPPLEMRMAEALSFMGGAPAAGTRSHWMRLPRPLDDPALEAALLAYASDYFLVDMAFRSRTESFSIAQRGTSVDHAMWFHRPVHFDRWHLHTQETVMLADDRALVRGSMHDVDGHLVATALQEVLIRARPGV